jgi:hypothetical protein
VQQAAQYQEQREEGRDAPHAQQVDGAQAAQPLLGQLVMKRGRRVGHGWSPGLGRNRCARGARALGPGERRAS